MTYPRATFPTSHPSSDPNIDGANLVISTAQDPDKIRAVKARMAPDGIVLYSIEAGLFGPESLDHTLTAFLSRTMIRSGKFMQMGTRRLEAIQCGSASMVDIYLRRISRWAEFPDSSLCVPYIDSAVWSYPIAQESGAPSDPRLFAAWREARCAKLREMMVGAPIWANHSGSLPGTWAGVKHEAFWTRKSRTDLAGVARLNYYLNWMSDTMERGSDLIFMVNPRIDWTAEQTRQHIVACALLYCGLCKNFPERRVYWCCDKYMDGTECDTSQWPRVAWALAQEVDWLVMESARVLVGIGSVTYRIVAGDYATPLRAVRA